MSKEIEKKFLVSNYDILFLSGCHQEIGKDEIVQGYLAIEPSGNEVRLRRKGIDDHFRHFLTAKSGHGLVRGEAETEITKKQFNILWPMTEGKRLEKTRFTLALSPTLKLEVDRFAGRLEGLILAEIEFPTEAEAASFIAPAWLRNDVTNDKRFKNQNLAIVESVKALRL